MLKTELICQSCDEQSIVVSLDNSPPSFCPYCASPILDEVELVLEDSDE